jgi:hypothetical protein
MIPCIGTVVSYVMPYDMVDLYSVTRYNGLGTTLLELGSLRNMAIYYMGHICNLFTY